MKRVLIVGADSYIGESFETYMDGKYDICTLDARGLVPDTGQFEGFDAVFYVAGIAHKKETKSNAHLYYEVNRDLAAACARTAKRAGVRQFIVMSTMAVYGCNEGMITKHTKPHPVTHYGKSKAQADDIIWKLSDNNFKAAVLRPPMVYGKGCKGNYQTLRKLALISPFFPDSDNQRSMIYIGNLCEFLGEVIDQEKSGLFFPQNKTYVNTSEMVQKIALIHDKKRMIGKFCWLKKFPVKAVKKAFGSLIYEPVDQAGQFEFEESIRITESSERTRYDRKPCVIVLTSHTPSLFWYRIDMMLSFMKKGYRVYALGNQPADQWNGRFSKYGIIYCQINIQRNGINPLNDLHTILSLIRLYKEIKPDKIFTYQAKSTICGGIAARIVHVKDVFPMVGGAGSVFLSNTAGIRILRTILVLGYKAAIGDVPAIFFQNREDKELFRRFGILSRQKAVMLHGSGVNIKQFSVMPQPERTVFLLIARLIKDKGVYEYLEACRRFKKVCREGRCLLAGPFDTNPTALKKKELKPYIEGGVIEYFEEQEDVRPILRQCSVFVLPSYREGTPKAILEAMACGRAVITTDVPGCRETVSDGENGFLVPAHDSKVLYKKMLFLYEHPQIAKEMGKKGRQMAENIFNVDFVNDVICHTMNMAEAD